MAIEIAAQIEIKSLAPRSGFVAAQKGCALLVGNIGHAVIGIAASQIDVSAGAYLSPTRRLSTGTAGSVQVGLNTTDSLRDPSIVLNAQFDATIRGFGFASGASFKARAGDILVSQARPSNYQGLWLQSDRFAAEGLSSVDLTGIFSASIGTDTAIRLVPQSYRFAQGAQAVTTPETLRASVATVELPIQDRKPTSFSMRSSATYSGVTEVGRGSRLEVSPGGSISIDASYQLLLAGNLRIKGREDGLVDLVGVDKSEGWNLAVLKTSNV
jgi:hypothetical protein